MARRGGIGPWGDKMRSENWEDTPTRGAVSESATASEAFPGSHMPGPGGWAPNPGGSSQGDPPVSDEAPPLLPKYKVRQNPTMDDRYQMPDPGPGTKPTWGQRWAAAGGGIGLLKTHQAQGFNAALGTLHPALPVAWEDAKWAFRGNRTTATYSPYREQMTYGGVQRDSMPTTRISTWDRRRETSTQTRQERRREWLNESEYYPPDHGNDLPSGLPPGAGADPINTTGSGMRPGAYESSDPLFNKNTSQRQQVNPQLFDPHQRATSGL